MSERARLAFLRRTTIPPAALERLGRKVAVSVRSRPELRAAAVRVTEAPPEAVERLRARIDLRPARRRPRWALGAAALVVAGALAGIGAWWSSGRDGPIDPSAPIEHVTLALDGEGRVGGTRKSPVITWDAGTLAVQVTPGQGVRLTVETPEAAVEVVGTAFVVRREHHATAVEVTEGTVHVTCTGAERIDLHVGERRTCLPEDPSALLLRAVELGRDGTDAATRLETLDRGLSLADDGPVRAELLAHRVRAAAESGATDEALRSAEAYLETGEPIRRAELVSFVARTRWDRDACGAEAALERAAAELPPGPEAVWLASCVVDRDPARARELLADLSWADDAWRDVAGRILLRAGR